MDHALSWCITQGTLERTDDFFLTAAQRADPPVRDRSQERTSALVRKPSYLPPIEIYAAKKWVERENGMVQDQEQIRAVRHLLGFGRAGAPLKKRIAEVLKVCLQESQTRTVNKLVP